MIKKSFDRLKHIFSRIMHDFKLILSDLLQNWLAAGIVCPKRIRIVLYRLAGNKIGKDCSLAPRIFLGPGPGKLFVGGGTFINYNCWFDLGDNIFIGNNCSIAMNVHFINSTHDIGDESRRSGKVKTGEIVIGPATWIGADTTIMPGVTIGKGVIVGAGSLVTSDLEDNAIYFGRPARLYKKL